MADSARVRRHVDLHYKSCLISGKSHIIMCKNKYHFVVTVVLSLPYKESERCGKELLLARHGFP